MAKRKRARAVFDPHAALAQAPRPRHATHSAFDHPRVLAWLKVWLPARAEGRLSWRAVLELIHAGAEAEGVPFPPRGGIGPRALHDWATRRGRING